MLRAFCFDFSLSRSRTSFGPPALWSILYLAELSTQNARNVGFRVDQIDCSFSTKLQSRATILIRNAADDRQPTTRDTSILAPILSFQWLTSHMSKRSNCKKMKIVLNIVLVALRRAIAHLVDHHHHHHHWSTRTAAPGRSTRR